LLIPLGKVKSDILADWYGILISGYAMDKKKYPKWAPKYLVDSLEARYKMAILFSDKDYADLLLKDKGFKGCSNEQIERYRARQYEAFSVFPQEKRIELLEKLLTDTRMKPAWTSISKRAKDNYEYEQFWQNCQEGIHKGRCSKKRSAAQHEKFFQKINKCSLVLSQMIEETTELDSFLIHELIDDRKIKELLTALHVPLTDSDEDRNVNIARLYLSFVIPPIYAVLNSRPCKIHLTVAVALYTSKFRQYMVVLRGSG